MERFLEILTIVRKDILMIIGSKAAKVAVLILHDLPEGTTKEGTRVHPMSPDWREAIIQAGGNNWRKIFNIYAKLCRTLMLEDQTFKTWQEYREERLLTSESSFQLLCFGDEKELKKQAGLFSEDTLVLVTGKKCAEAIGVDDQLHWLDQSFAQVIGRSWLVCPYFDYRQLSNIKIERLVELIRERISFD